MLSQFQAYWVPPGLSILQRLFDISLETPGIINFIFTFNTTSAFTWFLFPSCLLSLSIVDLSPDLCHVHTVYISLHSCPLAWSAPTLLSPGVIRGLKMPLLVLLHPLPCVCAPLLLDRGDVVSPAVLVPGWNRFHHSSTSHLLLHLGRLKYTKH